MEKYKNFIIIGVIILMILGGLKYISSDYSLKMKGLKTQRAALEERKKMLERWNNAESKYEENIKKMLSMGTEDFLSFIEKKAYESEIDIDSSRPYSTDKGIYWEMNIDMESASSYLKVVNFIKAVEEAKISIVKFKIDNLFDRKGQLTGRKTAVTLKGFIKK